MKRILILGGSGSWGQELTRQLLANDPESEIVIYSRGEHRQVEMARNFNDPRLHFVIGDVRDRERVTLAARGVDVVYHLAALKHVPVCERNPEEAIKTNILGTLNAIEAALTNNVRRFVFVSTDKAVDPINAYGVSKSMAEKIVISANLRTSATTFVCIRGGNVLGTQGSVVPLFKEQLLRANEITVTDRAMTRYLMRTQDAIGLLFTAAQQAKGGEIFVMKMPSIRVQTLVDVMIQRLGNGRTQVRVIGRRPGEKLHELLVSHQEGERAFEYGEYFVVLPSMEIRDVYAQWNHRDFLGREYNSADNRFLAAGELEQMLDTEGWLDTKPVRELGGLRKEQLLDFFRREGWR
jgi:FlaA1/EpsC-like NDP-sugar epimerase